MSVADIETEIKKLSSSELAKFAAWFDDYHGREWDEQIERDSRAGRLDSLIEQANKRFEAGECKPL